MLYWLLLLIYVSFCNCKTVNTVADYSRNERSFQSIKIDGFDGKWQNIQGASCSDNSPMITSRVLALSNSEMLRITNFGFDIPEESKISSIFAHFDVKVLGYIPLEGFKESVVQLVTDDGQSFLTPIRNISWERNLTRISFPMEGEDILWGNSNWSVSQINSRNFGIAVRARCGHTDTTGGIRCVSLSVTYEKKDVRETQTLTTDSATIDISSTNEDPGIHIPDPVGETTKPRNGLSEGAAVFVVSFFLFCFCVLCIAFGTVVRNWVRRYKKPISKGPRLQFFSDEHKGVELENIEKAKNKDDEIPNAISIYSEIGKGTYGTVWKGKMQDKEVACKCSNSTDENSEDTKKLMEELRILRELKHEKIVHLLGTYRGPFGNSYNHIFFVVTEFAENGNLKDLLKNQDLGQEILLDVCIDIVKGMCYLSKKKIIHRDLSARNILITKNFTAKISGFKKSIFLGENANIFLDKQQPLVLRNNPFYNVKWMAPESLKDSIYSTKTDIWSFGATLYEIWCKGSDPWSESNEQEAEDLIMKGATLELASNCPRKLKICVASMMDHESSKRLSFFQILVILNDIKGENAEGWSEIGGYENK